MKRYNRNGQLEAVLCNCCGKKLVVEHGIIREGSIGIDHAWDYFSEKDGQIHHFDLCEDCYDEMISGFKLPVETEDTLYVKFGEEYSEEGENLIVVPEAEGTINLAWYMYECIALTIPLKHTHPEGMCNPEMETLLKAHSAASDEISGDEEPVDPRWNALKKLKENK